MARTFQVDGFIFCWENIYNLITIQYFVFLYFQTWNIFLPDSNNCIDVAPLITKTKKMKFSLMHSKKTFR